LAGGRRHRQLNGRLVPDRRHRADTTPSVLRISTRLASSSMHIANIRTGATGLLVLRIECLENDPIELLVVIVLCAPLRSVVSVEIAQFAEREEPIEHQRLVAPVPRRTGVAVNERMHVVDAHRQRVRLGDQELDQFALVTPRVLPSVIPVLARCDHAGND
jgi:hypothetical protein